MVWKLRSDQDQALINMLKYRL